MASLLEGANYSILNAGGSLLDAGRRINRSGIGLSGNSRAALESFYSGASALFNQLYTKSENAEVANKMTILALRSKYSYLAQGGPFDDSAKTAAASTTNGTKVDTKA